MTLNPFKRLRDLGRENRSLREDPKQMPELYLTKEDE